MLVCTYLTVEPATTDDIPALFGQTHISHPPYHLVRSFWSRGKNQSHLSRLLLLLLLFSFLSKWLLRCGTSEYEWSSAAL